LDNGTDIFPYLAKIKKKSDSPKLVFAKIKNFQLAKIKNKFPEKKFKKFIIEKTDIRQNKFLPKLKKNPTFAKTCSRQKKFP